MIDLVLAGPEKSLQRLAEMIVLGIDQGRAARAITHTGFLHSVL